MYSIRTAGTRVNLETIKEATGANKADKFTQTSISENISVIFSFSASSINRHSQEIIVTLVNPLSSAATAKNQKSTAKAHMMQGAHHAKKSNTAVDSLRPNLSIIIPDKIEIIVCESIDIEATIPICISLRPILSI